MTIDEAIEHAEERACDKDHAQLADWLRELRRARMEIDLLKTLRDGFRADAQRYMADNTKLRELIQKVWKWESNGCYKCPLEKDCKVLCVYDGDCGMAMEIEKELRELGIEADE